MIFYVSHRHNAKIDDDGIPSDEVKTRLNQLVDKTLSMAKRNEPTIKM